MTWWFWSSKIATLRGLYLYQKVLKLKNLNKSTSLRNNFDVGFQIYQEPSNGNYIQQINPFECQICKSSLLKMSRIITTYQHPPISGVEQPLRGCWKWHSNSHPFGNPKGGSSVGDQSGPGDRRAGPFQARDPFQVNPPLRQGFVMLGGGNSNIFNVHSYLGKISNLTNIFRMGWNQQLVQMSHVFFQKVVPPVLQVRQLKDETISSSKLHKRLWSCIFWAFFDHVACILFWGRVCKFV